MKPFIKGIDAEMISNPGNSNAFVTIIWGWPDGRVEEEVVYREDMAETLMTLFPHLVGLVGAVKREAEAGRLRRKKKKRSAWERAPLSP